MIGITLLRVQSISWQWDMWIAIILCLWIAVSRHRYFCLWLLAGMCWGGMSFVYDVWQTHYDDSWLNQKIALQADVENIQYHGVYTRLGLNHIVRDDGQRLHGRVNVYLWSYKHLPKEGQRIHAIVSLHPPRNHQNPGGFDYESYCFKHHIGLTGSMGVDWFIVSAQQSMLARMRAKVRHALPKDAEEQGILSALLLAERYAIPIAIQDAFSATGTAHLLAISGLHVGMVAAWAGFLSFYFLTRRESWIIHIPVKAVSLMMGVAVAMAYASLADWPLPTQRAALMLVAAALAWYLRARYIPINILLAALMLILGWDPSAITSISLWLSFLATLALLMLMQSSPVSHNKVWVYFKSLMQVSLLASLATLPLMIDVFGRIPIWSLLANLLLVPLYSLYILPLALLGEIMALLSWHDGAMGIMQAAAWGIDIANQCLLHIHHWWGGNLWVVPPSWWWHALYILAWMGIAVWGFRQRNPRWMLWIAGVLLVYTLVIVQEKTPRETSWIAWDVGQGAAASLIQAMPNGKAHVFVIDVPGRKNSRFNGGTTVAAGLRHLGQTHIDVLMLSHAQSDHDGGALRLLDSIRSVGELWLADVPVNHRHRTLNNVVKRVQGMGGTVRWLKQGDVLPLGNATLHVLWPPQNYAPRNDNNTSLVCSIILKHKKRLLISGDMEKPVEKILLKQGLIGHHDMMLMPHHGSGTSSTLAFVQAVHPSYVIAQTAYHNHFGFPKPDIVQRYQAVGAKVLNTHKGAVIWYPQRQENNIHVFSSLNHAKYDAALQWVKLFL
ncbi:MAG: DNA internalization-related competence protein ComEC/Rec2 [Mariprofundaceae bacterium]|nr:DNA internalization-related competence protein ComEC/Rec2 [Mariprofundaceae bacterium]